jgi:hypothetical protein
VSENRDAARERAERAAAARHTAFLASVDREQSPRHGQAQPDPAARNGTAAGSDDGTAARDDRGAAPRDRIAVRTQLLDAARARVEADAKTRTAKSVRGVECEPFPRRLDALPPVSDLARPAAAYDCVAVTARLPGGEGIIGISFRLVAHFDRGTFAWCRVIPLGDRDRLSHPLPGACRLKK